MAGQMLKPLEILLADDNPGDVRLFIESLKDGKILNHLSVVWDGAEAMAYLKNKVLTGQAPRPDFIILDINMPKMTGLEVLQQIKSDLELMSIPVAVLTSSEAEKDMATSFAYDANCYITKPLDFEKFINAVLSIDNYWLAIVNNTDSQEELL
ncbi:response regulator [Methanocella conradii]|uniref:response regulator n=1 Tax=Methanocella conradii TaxID=1175444 RepID=UPI0024B33CE7|nr:response regulator [Methanocella conradii]MDI6897804.1 response regulator [Methanocella conradii]